jgi:predicted MFS family arabinose efflux permease
MPWIPRLGAAASFLLNNRIDRLWSYRVYVAIYIVGQLIAVFANNLAALYAARVITGIGIGSVTVIGPIALV